MKTPFVLLLLTLSAVSRLVSAQDFCGAEQLYRQRMLQDKAYAASVQQTTQIWQAALRSKKYQKTIITGKDTIYEIPVVVHIIHSGETPGSRFNPSDGEILDLMSYLNQSYTATWPSYVDTLHGGVRIPIRFTLAKRDPDCNLTTGINRIDGRVLPNYNDYGVSYDKTTPAPSDSAVKYLSKWPSGDYYNIWIVKYIDGPSGATAAAYAYYPFSTDLDGTVIAELYTRPVFSGLYYNALPHELGHALWMRHTFEGDEAGTKCPDNLDCTADGDGICDTEPHQRVSGCPSGTNLCTAIPYNNVQYNIMNYTSCADRFTQGQKERAMFALRQLRPGLISSLGATAPDATFVPPVAASCIPGIIHKDNDTDAGPRNISIGGITPSSYGYTGDSRKAYLDRTCTQQAAQLESGKAYGLDVSTGPGIENMSAWIDYNNDGLFGSGELIAFHPGTTSYETHSNSFVVPASGVITGKPLRMRIKSDLAAVATAPDPCADLQYGQVEDYSVVIKKTVSAGAQPELPEITVFPNPANGKVQIQGQGIYHIDLQSIEGKTLLQCDGCRELDLSLWAPGMYLVQIKDIQDSRTLKTIKLFRQ